MGAKPSSKDGAAALGDLGGDRLLPEEVLSFLRMIEEGKVTLTADEEPQEVYAGDIEYRASNGWRIVVFNDCNEWDYIDRIKSIDGRTVNFDQMFDNEEWEEVRKYFPSPEIAWRCYGIPGYLNSKTEKWLKPE